jgi:hypothetical protein
MLQIYPHGKNTVHKIINTFPCFMSNLWNIRKVSAEWKEYVMRNLFKITWHFSLSLTRLRRLIIKMLKMLMPA